MQCSVAKCVMKSDLLFSLRFAADRCWLVGGGAGTHQFSWNFPRFNVLFHDLSESVWALFKRVRGNVLKSVEVTHRCNWHPEIQSWYLSVHNFETWHF